MNDSAITQPQTRYKILLIGDNCIDVYQYGTIDRLSPEAPVPVFVPKYKETKVGMAANVLANLESLGCEVNFLTGKQSSKTRLIDIRSKQHIARIDEDVVSEPIRLETEIPDIYDAVVISDYAKGTVDYDLISEIINTVKCPIFIDTKLTDLERMQGAWVKINSLEFSRIKTECTGLIVTEGEKGARVVHHDIHVPSPKVEVVDVTGAGDTFLAALTYGYLTHKEIKQAVVFANKAASITVQHVGCYAPSIKEIQ